MGRYAEFNFEVVQGDDQPLSFTFATVGGAAINVTAWDFYFKAQRDDHADTVVIAPASVVKSDSGTGTTDTATFNLTDTITDVEPGAYEYEVAIGRSGLVETLFRGTMVVPERITAVTP